MGQATGLWIFKALGFPERGWVITGDLALAAGLPGLSTPRCARWAAQEGPLVTASSSVAFYPVPGSCPQQAHRPEQCYPFLGTAACKAYVSWQAAVCNCLPDFCHSWVVVPYTEFLRRVLTLPPDLASSHILHRPPSNRQPGYAYFISSGNPGPHILMGLKQNSRLPCPLETSPFLAQFMATPLPSACLHTASAFALMGAATAQERDSAADPEFPVQASLPRASDQ